MTTKIITDSCADISPIEAKMSDITVIPAYVHFGDKSYRDGVDLDVDEFYSRLLESPIHPTTAAPSPGEFVKAYEEAAKESDEIISIHVTSKHSTMYNSALMGKQLFNRKGCRIAVVDSKGISMWQGFVAIAAAKAARNGQNLRQIVEKLQTTIENLHALALLDTVKYAIRGGRLGTAVSAIESLLNVKVFITLRDGEIRPVGIARTYRKGISRLLNFLQSTPHLKEIAIVHSTTSEEAQSLAAESQLLFPHITPRICRLGPALGVHGGPGAIGIILQSSTSAKAHISNLKVG
jgi:DegV family protein with EDD domain